MDIKLNSNVKLVLLLVGLIPATSYATETIATGTTRTITSSPWHPNGDVIIEANAFLEITSGTIVQMDPGAKIQVKIDGRLNATGTSTSKITFTSFGSTHWKGIEILGNANNHNQAHEFDAYYGWNTFINGASAEKGAAWFEHCIIEKSNYGTVVGEILPNNKINVTVGTSKGGGNISLSDVEFNHIDYMAICLTPFVRKSNIGFNLPIQATITFCTIYDDYNNVNFQGIGLYNVWLQHAINHCTIENRLTGSDTKNTITASYGIYERESKGGAQYNTIKGLHVAIRVDDIYTVYPKLYYQNTLINNWYDIVSRTSNNITIENNTSTKYASSRENYHFTSLTGDNYNILHNTCSVNVGSGTMSFPIGTAQYTGSTPTGKRTAYNTFTDYPFGIWSQQSNYGMHYVCNTFAGTASIYNIAVTSGGVAKEQGTKSRGVYNTFSTSCTGEMHWKQNSSATPVNYWWKGITPGQITGYPICKTAPTTGYGVTVKTSTIFSGCSYPQPKYLASPIVVIKNKLDSVVTEMQGLPVSTTTMTADQLSAFYYTRDQRDIYLSELIQKYIDTAFFDSAFYVMNQYPCLRSSLDKMNLKLTLGDFSNISAITNEISAYYNNCDTGYCDTSLGNKAQIYYPMLVSLIQNNFSDSILNAKHNTLIAMAGSKNYYGGLAQTILQLHYDSLFKVYTPRDTTFTPTILYPLVLEELDNDVPPDAVQFTSVDNSIKEITEIKLYPNPASDILMLDITENILEKNSLKYDIHTIIGQKVMAGSINGNAGTAKINISSLSEGLYILEVIDAGKVYRSKFTVK